MLLPTEKVSSSQVDHTPLWREIGNIRSYPLLKQWEMSLPQDTLNWHALPLQTPPAVVISNFATPEDHGHS
jgi:hypothetical protein